MLHNNILKIRDENGLGDIYNELDLSFENAKVTIKDIITERVFQEVEKYNQKADAYKYALVTPREEELQLNRSQNLKHRRINPEKQVEIALRGFESNGFFILVNDLQVGRLDTIVTVGPDTTISFIKLTPLVGG
jgi:hypothetical protein